LLTLTAPENDNTMPNYQLTIDGKTQQVAKHKAHRQTLIQTTFYGRSRI